MPKREQHPVMRERYEKNAHIRRIIKSQTPTVRVTAGKGTASSWVHIHGSGEYGFFTEPEKKGLHSLGLTALGANAYGMDSSDQRAFLEKFGKFKRR